jgi:pimeloyl-ACP methyl ester carboxylesterase
MLLARAAGHYVVAKEKHMPNKSRFSQKERPSLLSKALILSPLAAVAAWNIYRKLFIPQALPLPPALPGERRVFQGRAGKLSYYVAGEGEPLLLIHSINAGASSYEVRPIFEYFQQSRRVYALDLPGFGFSERSKRHYSPRLYSDAILDMIDEIQNQGDQIPVDALALSLGAEFLARAAVAQPDVFRSLVLMTPTGFSDRYQRYGPNNSTRFRPILHGLFASPLLGRSFFDLLTTKPSIRYFLNKAFGSYETIDQGLEGYDYLSAHQVGAEHAPFYFISGGLFSTDIGHIYEALDLPVWVPYGVKDAFTSFEAIDTLQDRPLWLFEAFDCGGLIHFEELELFIEKYKRFFVRSILQQ